MTEMATEPVLYGRLVIVGEYFSRVCLTGPRGGRRRLG